MARPWYREVIDILSIQQAEVFLLHGDIYGYPEYPGEHLVDYLRRMAFAPVRRQIEEALPKGQQWADVAEEDQIRQLAEKHLFVSFLPATGLDFGNAVQQDAFNRFSPPPESNPFAQASGGILDSFARLDVYFQNPEALPMTLVVQGGDLLFDGSGPLVEPERTLISYIRRWASSPLLAQGEPHRIFLVVPYEQGIRPALLQGRIASIKMPLPDEALRQRFIDEVLDGNDDPERKKLTLEPGLSRQQLAHLTGALNLVHVEDIIYRAELEGGEITRKIAQARKDALVSQAYAGVIEIQYPETGFDDIVGYQELKAYMTRYVYPKLTATDKRCPKGCILSGPPGTGKTEFAKALANALKLPLVIVRTDKIKDKFVGETNKNMARLCEGIVTLSPAIVLIDEIDKLLPTGDDNTGVAQEMLGQLQTFMSDIPRGKAFFIGTTNYPKVIPRALLRPGRFEQVIPLLPQHLDGLRGQVLERIAQRLGVGLEENLSQDNLDELGARAMDYTGADIEKLLIEADREATENNRNQINSADLSQALSYVVPTLKSTESMVEEALAFCSNRRFVPESMQDRVGDTPRVVAKEARRIRRIS